MGLFTPKKNEAVDTVLYGTLSEEQKDMYGMFRLVLGFCLLPSITLSTRKHVLSLICKSHQRDQISHDEI